MKKEVIDSENAQVETLEVSESDKQVWTMTPEQSADLKALHDSIKLAPDTDISETPPEESRLTVGTEAWHKRRRENHKFVERKRREAINQGINEIASNIPGCEKNKGSILNRAVEYIKQLKDQEIAMLDKASLDRMFSEQESKNINQHLKLYQEQADALSLKINTYQQEIDRVQQENNLLKQRLKQEN